MLTLKWGLTVHTHSIDPFIQPQGKLVPATTFLNMSGKSGITWHIRRPCMKEKKKKIKTNMYIEDSKWNRESSNNKNNNFKEMLENILALKQRHAVMKKNNQRTREVLKDKN